MMKKILLLCVAATGMIQLQAQKIYNILDFGAKGDGQTSNTTVIQKSIDQAHADGGGTVMIPAGRFITGVIELKSNVTIHLAKGADLLGSTKRIDYGPSSASALIVATGQHHIGLTGKGTINGQGPELLKDIYAMLQAGTLQDNEWKMENPWHQVRPEERNRPKLIEFKNCDSVTIKGISIRDGLCWIQNYKNCSNLLVDSIYVESNVMWNNDGIDVVDCVNARITNSFFNADDDGICLKSEDRNRRCENIFVANCTVRSSASAVKFGTASHGGFKNIVVRNIKVYDTYRSAIALEAVDGGILEDVSVSNIVATNTGNAIFIRLGHRNKDSVISKVRRVHISNIKAFIPAGKPDKGYPMEGPPVKARHNVYPSSISGIPGNAVEDVTLDSIDIVYEGGAHRDSAFVSPDSLAAITDNINGYPEFSMFGELPSWGFYVRHVKGISMKNIRISYKKEDFRPAMIFDDVDGIRLQQLVIGSGTHPQPLIMHDTKNRTIQNIQFPGKNKNNITLTGTK